MSITFNSTEIKINDGTYTFDEIYNIAVQTNKTQYIDKLGSCYKITNDLRIMNGAKIIDNDVNVTVLGDLLQIEKGGLLQLGDIDSNNVITGNSVLNAPNIKLVYGFGCTTKTNSGDLKIYGSIINIFGFWSFFEGNNVVELIENKIDGFGRISGSSSVFKNNMIKKAHGQYGTFATFGDIAIDSGTEVYESQQSGNFKVAVYHNPAYSHNMNVMNGVYSGYDKLAYIESESGGNTLTFIDSEVLNGYTMERETSNVDFYHKFTFNPIIMNASGTALANADIVIKDNAGSIVNTLNTDNNGRVNVQVTYFTSDKYSNEKYHTPHTVEMTHNSITTTVTINIDKPLIDIPLYILEGSGGSSSGTDNVDYDRIQAMITANGTSVCNCVDGVKSVVEDGNANINQVLLTLGEEVNENQSIIEGKNGAKMFL